MARGKVKVGKQVLTEDELLAQALVPEDEQPYPIPENWVWVRLLSGFNNVTSSYKKIQQKDYLEEGQFAVVDQGKELIGGYTNEEGLLYSGKLPIIVFGDHTRKIKYIDFPFVQGADGVKLLHPNIFVHGKFLYYSMQNIDIPDLGYRRHFPLFPHFKFPLPPITEQQRIVECIDSLFEKLDLAKELVQNILDGFETRKAAILHKAFTGDLTVKWRKKNGVEMESWETRNLQSVCSMKITDGTHQTPTYCEKSSGVPFISAKDVTSGFINWADIKYITSELHEELYERLAPQRNDILLAKNGTTGIAAIVDTDIVFDIYVTLAVLRPDTSCIVPQYLLNIINSPISKVQFDEKLIGIGVPNLHLRDIKEVEIHLPSIPEQQEIVHILNSLLEKEQRTRDLCDVIEKIDMMKKTILARAFRGMLGTNEPSEESAMGLVREGLACEASYV